MKKFLSLVFAILLIALGVQPAKAADVTFTVKLTGSSESFLGAIGVLFDGTGRYVQPFSADGVATFTVPASSYFFTFSSTDAPALAGLSYYDPNGQRVTAPGSMQLMVPTPRYTSVRYVLPDGSLLPGIKSQGTDGATKVTASDGTAWLAAIGKAVARNNGVTTYRVYIPAGSRGTSTDTNFDKDGDGYNDPTVMLSTANGGYFNFAIPSSALINGGEVKVADASYVVFDQTSAQGAVGSKFTITGHVGSAGKGTAGTTIFGNFQTTSVADPCLGCGGQFRTQVNADGTFSLAYYLQKTSVFISATLVNGTYSFPSAALPVTTYPAKSTYKSCAALNSDFQGGVTLDFNPKNKGAALKYSPTWNPRLYKAVKSLDVDKDGIACEK